MTKNNYKRLGDYIEKVDVRNTENLDIPLMGLSITKEFIPSVANIIGTDLSNYKIIKENQFACSLMQVSRDGKIPIARFPEGKAIMSPAYPMFEVTNTNELDPKYLMMWFSRSEFDREASFYAVGGVRGSLEWQDFEDMLLPIPSIEKQSQIVADYQAVENKIKINEAICEKLEETAQTIYRRWFEELEEEKEIITVKEFCLDMKSGGTPSRTKNEYWNKKEIPWLKTGEIKNNILIEAEEYISKKGLEKSSAKLLPKGTVLMSMYGVNAGDLGVLKFESTTNQACCGMICKNDHDAAFLYYHLLHNQSYIASQSIGGAQENLSKNYIENIELPIPDENIDLNELKIIIDNKEMYTRETQKLHQLQTLLLGRMTREEEKIAI